VEIKRYFFMNEFETVKQRIITKLLVTKTLCF